MVYNGEIMQNHLVLMMYFRLFCGTWNTNGQAASAPIKAWLSPQEDDIPPDIYAIG